MMQPSEMRAIDAFMDKRFERLAVKVTALEGHNIYRVCIYTHHQICNCRSGTQHIIQAFSCVRSFSAMLPAAPVFAFPWQHLPCHR